MTSSNDVLIELLGRQLRVDTIVNIEDINKAVFIVESIFNNMENFYAAKWSTPPSALDTSSWLLIGALNIAYRIVCLEKETCQNNQNLEHTISKLLADVSNETDVKIATE